MAKVDKTSSTVELDYVVALELTHLSKERFAFVRVSSPVKYKYQRVLPVHH